MRIFCAVRHSIDREHFYGGLWGDNFHAALCALGHEIIPSQTDLFPTSMFMDIAGDFTRAELEVRARTTERILDEVRATHKYAPVHLFLSYFYNAHCDPALFDELRRLGILSINFFCNSIHQFDLVKAVAAKADFAWHAEKEARRRYLDAGANPVWVQMGANPDVYHPLPDVQRLPRACFVGQRYADRERWIAALIRAGVPIDVYGYGWTAASNGTASSSPEDDKNKTCYLERARRTPGSWESYLEAGLENILRCGLVSGLVRSARQARYRSVTRSLLPLLAKSACGPAANLSSVFAKYDICLNFSNVWSDGRPGSSLISHVRLRDFEGPMSRTCYLTGHNEEIGEFYDIGREIDTYTTPDELINKTRFYLGRPEAAERLRESGYRRALREHTWRSRFEELFQKTGISLGN
jgi:spore maturation protein CgeB